MKLPLLAAAPQPSATPKITTHKSGAPSGTHAGTASGGPAGSPEAGFGAHLREAMGRRPEGHGTDRDTDAAARPLAPNAMPAAGGAPDAPAPDPGAQAAVNPAAAADPATAQFWAATFAQLAPAPLDDVSGSPVLAPQLSTDSSSVDTASATAAPAPAAPAGVPAVQNEAGPVLLTGELPASTPSSAVPTPGVQVSGTPGTQAVAVGPVSDEPTAAPATPAVDQTALTVPAAALPQPSAAPARESMQSGPASGTADSKPGTGDTHPTAESTPTAATTPTVPTAGAADLQAPKAPVSPGSRTVQVADQAGPGVDEPQPAPVSPVAGHVSDGMPQDAPATAAIPGAPAVPGTLAAAPTPFPAQALPMSAPAAAAGAAVVAPPLAEQLARPLFSLAGAPLGEHVMTVNVVPEGLGPVTVRAHLAADGIRIELVSATDAGRDSLRTLLPDLKRDLAAGGLASSLSLGTGSGAPEQGAGQQRSHTGPAHPLAVAGRGEPPAQAERHNAPPPAAINSSLDITV